jgi:TPR repeat protein
VRALAAVTAVFLVLLGAQSGRASWLFDWALKDCVRGGPSGCFVVGDTYWEGRSVPRDQARAELFYARGVAGLERACDAGEGGWCAYLGRLHERGTGVPQDLGRARALYLRACALGYGAGCGAAGRAGNAVP